MSVQKTFSESGSTQDFHNLIMLYLPTLRQQALALTRHKADAEDLLHAAITCALGAQHSFVVGTNFKAWMSCILRNRFLSNLRQRRFHSHIDDIPESQLEFKANQESSVEFKELMALLLRLPADQRQILQMVTLDGMSYDEAAAELGVAVGTLKCRVFRARAQLEAWVSGADQSTHPKKLNRKIPAVPAHQIHMLAEPEILLAA